MTRVIAVPELFVRETSEREGEAGKAWLDALPGLVDHALAKWALTPSGPTMHGAVGVVIPVLRADETAAVLKISFPHPGNVAEPKALTAWAGRGAVRLLEHDAEAFAMVLEKAGSDSLRDLHDAAELDRERVVRWVQACAVKDTLWSVEFGESPERAAVNKTVATIACSP